VPLADEAEQQLSSLALSACELSAVVRIFRAALPESPTMAPKVTLKFDLARQARSTNLCASLQAVPWADEAEQKLSRPALSGCELYADLSIFRAGLLEAPRKDRLCYV